MGQRVVNAYIAELERITEHFRREWKMNYAEAIGCLSIEKDRIQAECRHIREEKEDQDDKDDSS